MYFIQYYKREKKSILESPDCSSDSKKSNCMKRRRYLYQKELIDKCSNIKSLTIDLADIKNVIYDYNLNHLISLYARINRLKTTGIDSITILNNNNINLLYIYEIINCEWMINKEEFTYSEELVVEKIKELNVLINQYEKSNKQGDKIKLKNKIHLFKYLINSTSSKEILQKENVKVLKLGKRITLEK